MNWQEEWQSVTESPDYQQANDSNREAMRNDYFNQRIAPNFFRHEMAEAKGIFDEYTAPQGNPDGTFLSDSLNLAKAGFQGALADMSQGATLGNRNFISDWLRKASEETMMEVTPSMLEAMEATGIDYNPDDGLSIKEDSSFKGLVGHVVQGGGSLPVSMGVGGALGKGFSIAGRAMAGSTAAAKASVLAGNTKRARQILNAQRTAATVGNSAGFGTMGAGMMVGGVASQSYDEVMAMPDEEIRQLAPFQNLVQEELQNYPNDPAMAEASARERLAKDVSLNGRMMSGALGFVTSVMSGPIQQNILLGRGAQTRPGNILRGMITETGEEFSESASQQYMSNLNQIEVADREMDVMDGVISTGATGAVSGGILGGMIGAGSRPNRPKSKEQIQQEINADKLEMRRLRDALKDEKLKDTERDQTEAELANRFEQMVQREHAQKEAPTEEQLSRQAKNKPDPVTDDGSYQGLDASSGKNWVYPDIEKRLSAARNEYRKAQTEYNRSMAKGGNDRLAGYYEGQLRDKQALVDSYQFLYDNRSNQQYFASEAEFQDWSRRMLKGGDEAVRAQAELFLRQDGLITMDGMANIERQVSRRVMQDARASAMQSVRQLRSGAGVEGQRPVSQKQALARRLNRPLAERRAEHRQKKAEEQRREQHITDQELAWEQLQQEMQQTKQAAQRMRGMRSMEERGRELAPGSRAKKIATTMPSKQMAQAFEQRRQTRQKRRENKQQLNQQKQQKQQAVNDLQAISDNSIARHALFTLKNGETARIRYGDGKTLNIENGRFDQKAMQDFISHNRQAADQAVKSRRKKSRKEALKSVESSKKAQGSKALNRVKSSRLVKQLSDFSTSDSRISLVRAVRSALAGNKDLDLTYGDRKKLTIRNGQVGIKSLQRFVDEMRKPPEVSPGKTAETGRRDRQKQLTKKRQELESKTGKTGSEAIRDAIMDRHHLRGQLRSLPAELLNDWKVRSVLKALNEDGNISLSYGKNKHLRIRNGNYERGQLRDFVDYMQAEARTLAQKQEAARKTAEAQAKPAEPQQKKSFTERALDHWVKKTGDKSFAVKRATHIHTDPVTGEKEPVMYVGRPMGHEFGDVFMDHQGLEYTGKSDEFTPITGREFMYSDLMPKQASKPEPERKNKFDRIIDDWLEQPTRYALQHEERKEFAGLRATHIRTNPRTGDKEPVQFVEFRDGKPLYITDRYIEITDEAGEFAPIPGREFMYQDDWPDLKPTNKPEPPMLKKLREDIKAEKDRRIKEREEEFRRPKPYAKSDATHVYKPKGGKELLVKPVTDAGMGGWWRSPDGHVHFLAGDKNRLKSLKEIEQDKERQRKHDEAEERKKQLEKARELQDIAKQEAERKKRFKNSFLTRAFVSHFLGDHRIYYEPEESGLTVVESKGDHHLVDINGDRLTAEQLTGYVDEVKRHGFFKYEPPKKVKPTKLPTIRQKNLQDKEVIGNGKGEAWNKEHNAKHQLKKLGLEKTHYVSGDNNYFVLRKIPDLSGIKWEYQSYERNGAIETILVPTNLQHGQAGQLRDYTGHRFIQYRTPKEMIIEGMAEPKKGDPVIKLKGSKEGFLERLAETAPSVPEKSVTEKPSAKPAPEKAPETTGDIKTLDDLKDAALKAGVRKQEKGIDHLHLPEGDHYLQVEGADGTVHAGRLVTISKLPDKTGRHSEFVFSLELPDGSIKSFDDHKSARLVSKPPARIKERLKKIGGKDGILKGRSKPEEAQPDKTQAGKAAGQTVESGHVESGTGKAVKEAVAAANSYHRNMNKLADFFTSLPASTLGHFPTLAKALKKSPIGERFRFDKDRNGILTLKDLKTGRRLIPPASITRGEYYDFLLHQIAGYARSDQPLDNDTFPDSARMNSSQKFAIQQIMDGVPGTESFTRADTTDVGKLKDLNKPDHPTDTKPESVTGYSDQHPKWATDFEKDYTGAKVIYSDQTHAILEAYSRGSGEPNYSVIMKEGDRSFISRGSLKNYSGDGLTKAKKQQLLEVEAAWRKAEEDKHKQQPDGPFAKGQQVAASDDIDSKLVRIADQWLKMLGINKRVFIASPFSNTPQAAEKYGLYGPYSAIRHASDPSTSSGGYMRKLPNGDYFIMLKPKKSERMTVTLAHEIGHIVEMEAFNNADVDTKNEIIRAFNQWIAEHKPNVNVPGSAKQLIETVRHPLTADVKGITDQSTINDISDYWSTFTEWFADNTARWATTQEKPLSVVDKFFKSVANQLRKLYQALKGKKYLPNEKVKQFLDELGPPDVSSIKKLNPETAKEVAAEVAEAVSVNTLSGDRASIEKTITDHLIAGQRISDSYNTYWIADKSDTKGGGWVLTKKDNETGRTSTKGGVAMSAWTQMDAVDAALKNLDYAIGESAKGETHETGRTGGDEPLAGAPAGQVPPAGTAGPAEGGSGKGGRTGSRADGKTDRSGTEPSGGEGDRGEGADLSSAATTSESDLQQRTGGVESGASDFTINSDIAEAIAGGGRKSFNEKQRYEDNIAAIKLLKELGDRPATAEQMEVLAKYVGWGGLQSAFPNEAGKTAKGWKDQVKQLKDLLTADEYAAALESTPNAHYTTPAIVNAIYDANKRFGAYHGRILEPSVGTGNFLGLMPTDMRGNSRISAVELDVISGQIAKKLYPSAKVNTPMGFQNFDLANNSYDMVVANPPFGADTITDPSRKDISGWRVHNYFLAKSMDALRPGGVMSVVVSKGWMDSNYNQQGRDRMFRDAKLLGAFRLPSDAFKANANTDVTTDLLFFQKREEPLTKDQLTTPPAGEIDFRNKAGFIGSDQSSMNINQYFVSQPDRILGDAITSETGMYGPGKRDLVVSREGLDWQQALIDGINNLPQRVFNPEHNVSIDLHPDTSMDIHHADVGGLYLSDDGKLMRRDPDIEGEKYGLPVAGYTNANGEFIAYKQGDINKLNQLLPMARTARELIKKQVTEATDQELKPLRDELNRQYDEFVKKNKALSREANKRLLYNSDPTIAPMLLALESRYDKEITKAVAAKTGQTARKEQATKADIFTRRTQSPYSVPTKADSSHAGLVISLSQTGKVDMDMMSDLTGKDHAALYKELKGQIYLDPKAGWQTKDAYLSGNVKEKLRQAQEMVAQGHFDDTGQQLGTSFQENIDALKKVIPKDVPATDITVRMGSVWQPPAVISDFWQHLLGGTAKTSFVPTTNKWFFKGHSDRSDLIKKWSSDGAPAGFLMERILNNRQIVIKKEGPDKKLVTDKKATEAANLKAEEIQSEFENWIWQEPQRRNDLVKSYNDLMNTTVNRTFDGSHLQFPGKVSDDIIKFRTTQSNAIWRTLQNPNTLLDHVVGAGKTFTMVGSAMEMRRTGLAKKPMIVVPNHLVEQWAADFALLYPNAKVLAASSKDFGKRRRKQLFARVATGDWDAVIVSHTSFGKLPSDPQAEEAFLRQHLKDLTESEVAVRESEGKDSRSTKELQKAKKRLKEKLKELLDNTDKDTGLNFQELGIDALFLDEAHEFKNLEFQTALNRVKNINSAGSNKAADMFIKTQSINSRGGKLVFATGTPISNSMAEMFSMQRYLGYDALKKQGLAHFDAWAKQFGSVETRLERKPSGKYEPESRFAKFINLPELMQQSREFSDVINNTDIIAALEAEGKGKHIPNVKGGRPANTVAERSMYQEGYMADIEHRFADMPDDPRVDNPLKATNDARKAALDMRMIYPDLPDFAGSKINQSVDNMMRIYSHWSGDKGTQLVFCDLSTPKGKSTDKAIKIFREKLGALTNDWRYIRDIKNTEPDGLYNLLMEMSGDPDHVDTDRAVQLLEKTNPDDIESMGARFDVYNDVKQKLMAKGVPESEIAFIHDAANDKQKAELFDAVNTGKVRFLLGSTAKMGAGTNVQERMVALHHLDAPWRPSDLEQREGRIIRQGNELYIRDPEGFEVEIHRYATEMTYDTNMWQTLEVKANFIEQLRNGDPTVREAQDVAGEAASAADMKAASSGDPRILEQVEIQRRLGTLQNLRRTHQSDQLHIGMTLEYKQRELQSQQAVLEAIQDDYNALTPVPTNKKGERLPAYVSESGKTFKSTKEVTAELNSRINDHQASLLEGPQTIGTFRGMDIQAEISYSSGDQVLDVWLQGKHDYPVYENYNTRAEGDNYHLSGIYSRLGNAVGRIDKGVKEAQYNLANIPKEIKGLQEQHGQPFKFAKEYEEKKVRNQQLLEELGATDKTNEAAQKLPEYDQLMQEHQYYESAVQAASDDANRLINQVQLSRVTRLLERLRYAPEGKESEIAQTVKPGLEKIKSETQDLSRYAQIASYYRLAEPDAPLKNYQSKGISRQLQNRIGDMATVVRNESDLPALLRDQIAQDRVSGMVKGIYDPVTDQVYVVASHAESVRDGIETALHEAIGHKGLRNLLGDSLNSVLDQVYHSLDSSRIRDMRDRYTNQIAGKPSKEQQRLLAEEHLAHLAETDPKNNLLQKVIARVRRWLRKHFPSLKFSDNDLRQLIIDAKAQASDSVAISQSDQGSGARYKMDSAPEAVSKLDKLNQFDKEAFKESTAQNLESMKDKILGSGSLGVLGGRQIRRVFSKTFDAMGTGNDNPLTKIDLMTQAMGNLRGQWAHKAEQADNTWSKLAGDKWAYQELNNLMYDSTLAGVDPRWKEYQPKYGDIKELRAKRDKATGRNQKRLDRQLAEETRRLKDYNHLKEKHKLLGQRNNLTHKVFDEISDYYDQQFKATLKALNDRVEGMKLDPNATGTLKSEIEALFTKGMKDGVYFPLMRYGSYAVVAQTPDGQHYREHFESLKDMKLGRAELESQGYKIVSTGKTAEIQSSQLSGVSEFTGKIYKALQADRNQNIDDATKLQFMDEINQLSLAMLPELSAAKRSMHRRKVPGFDTNARRAFNSVALHGSNRLSRIEYGWQIESELNRMDDAVSETNADSPLSDNDKITGRSVAVEMRKRHDDNMNPKGNALSANIVNGTFVMTMGASMGAGLVNMTQNLLVGLPVLAGQYGFRKSFRIMGSAMMDYVRNGGQKQNINDFGDFVNNPWLSLHNAKPNSKISADEIAIIKALVEDGTIETSPAHSIAARAGSDIQPETQIKREWMQKAMKASGMFFHNAEVFNRQLIALTALRLYKENHSLKTDADMLKAQQYVRDQVLDAHFDYSSYNRPRHFKSNMAKVMLIFKQYSQNMTFHLGNAFREGFLDKAATQAERDAAKKVLYTTLGMHFAFAGALGLPLVGTALKGLQLAFGDEDDPENFKTKMRNNLSDAVGPTMGHILSKGLFDGALNIGMHTRTNLDNLWFSDPGYEMSTRQKGMHYFTQIFGGPAANIGINSAVGLTEMAQGDTLRGLQRIMPKFIRDGVRAIDYSANGIVDRNGRVLQDDYRLSEAVMQTVGIAPARQSELWDASSAMTGYENALTKRRNDLLRQLDRAVRNDNKRQEARVRKQIDVFNSRHRGNEQTEWAVISGQQLRRSLRSKEKAREQAVLGRVLPSTRSGMTETLRGYNY